MNNSYSISRFLKSMVLILLLLISCNNGKETPAPQITNNAIKYLPLKGEISEKKSEISGLAWYNEQLIILPQYPHRFPKNGVGALFRIPKEDLLAYIDGETNEEFDPIPIEFDDGSIADSIDGFQGYEAMQLDGDKVYFLIEANDAGKMKAYMISGVFSEGSFRIHLDHSSLRPLPLSANLENFAYESIVISGDTVYSFYEANGINVNPDAHSIGINTRTGESLTVPFPTIEYRITDATSMDDNNNLWIINYFWPGDYHLLAPGADSIRIRRDSTAQIPPNFPVERLLELHYTGSLFELTQTDPIYLGQRSNGQSRNWEGIVRLHNRGFIIATDKHPRTILAFVPHGTDRDE